MSIVGKAFVYDGNSQSSSSVRLVSLRRMCARSRRLSVPLPLWLQFRGQFTVVAGANVHTDIKAKNDAQGNLTSQESTFILKHTNKKTNKSS